MNNVIHLGHKFDCCFNLVCDVQQRKGAFIQTVNEICTEFKFAHPLCKVKLLQIYGSSFYGSNLWNLYDKTCESLYKTYNIGIRKIFSLPWCTHTRYLTHLSCLNDLDHILKCRLVKFLCNNLSC